MSTPENPPADPSPHDGEATRYSTAPPADPDATGCKASPADANATNYRSASADPDATGYTPTPTDARRSSGRRTLPCAFGDYELVEEIARGGMGVVYKARQKVGGGERFVALKMIQAGRLASPEAVERFLQEARAAATLDHPGIVPIHDVGAIDERHYFTMPLLTGGSLAERVREGPLPPLLAARLVRQVAEAVQHAHEQGIIHRDLKPANILISGPARGGEPGTCTQGPGAEPSSSASKRSAADAMAAKVTDFGLARTRESGLSVTGEALGTPSYMPPEQARGQVKAMGPACDVYGLGAVLYCLLTGRPPFQSADPVETMRQVCEADPVAPRQLNPQVPRDVETICLKCLEKEPGKRYLSAADVAEELARVERGEPVQARPVGRPERAWRWCRRNPAVASLIALAALLMVAGTSVSTVFALDAADNARVARDKADDADRERKKAEQSAKREKELAGKEAEARADAEKLARDRAVALNDVVAEKEKVKKELAKAEFVAYAFRLREAQGEIQRGRTSDAEAVLRLCDPKLQRWEHDYLLRQTQRILWTGGKHTSTVSSVCMSPDGKRIVSGSWDHTVKVWDAATGQEALSLKDRFSAVISVCMSPDGKRIVSGSGDNTVKVWDAATGQEVLSLKGHTDFVRSVCMSPDGKRIVSGSDDHTVKVWDAATGQDLLTLKGHTSTVYSVCMSPDGKRIVSGSDDHTVKVWDAATGQEAFSLKGHTSTVYSVCMSPDGKRIVSGSRDNTVKVWDAATGQEAFSLKGHTSTVYSVCMSPDGKRIVSGSLDHTVKVWDAATGQEVLSLKGHADSVMSVCMSPDGKRIVSGSEDNTVKVWDAATGQEALSLKAHTEGVSSVCMSPDGKRIVLGSGDNTVKVWDAATSQEPLSLKGHNGFVTSVCMSPDGKRIVSGARTVR